MSKIIIPANYTPALNLYDTQRAIGTVKRLFADTLCATLNLYRVSAPLFVEASTGLNDDLNGVERKVTFDTKDSGIEPALKLAYDRYHGGGIGVMATPMTLREEKFEALMHRYDQSCRIYKIPAPGLVELVERGQADSPEAESLLRELFAPYQGKLDEVVLGCTHYPFAAKAISRVLGSGVALLDGGDGTARETRRRLAEAGLLENGTGEVILTNSLPDESILELSRKLLDEK